MNRRRLSSAFSLVELVIVIVILGVIAAIAVPRISRGATGAGESGLRGDLYILRNALDLYAAEHGGSFPTIANFSDQLTKYTDAAGGAVDTKDATHIYGAYLVKVPMQKLGQYKNNAEVGANAAAAKGWVYDAINGKISANTGALADNNSVLYSDY